MISREVYSYDPIFTQLETERRADIWLSDSMDWQWSSRLVREYDSNANLTSNTKQKWDINGNNWLNEMRSLINYNANGDPTLTTELAWNGQQWGNSFQIKNTYDSVFNKTRSEVFHWDMDEWQPSQTCDFYYTFHQEIVAVDEVQHFTCKVPNPYRVGTPVYCHDFSVQTAVQLNIFDLSGKLIYSKQIENQNFINIAQSIPTGLYVLNISNGKGQHFSKKIVIVDK